MWLIADMEPRTWLQFLLQSLVFAVVAATVLDISNPIVYQDPQISTTQRSSYFGYSLLLYSRNNYTWLQIGAPRANCSSLKGIKEPGRVYRCGVAGLCEPVYLDNNGNIKESYVLNKRDGSWFGGTMALHPNADKMVVCAPRWINQTYDHYMLQGACYSTRPSNRDLSLGDVPKLLPLNDMNHRFKEIQSSSPGKKKEFAYDYAMGQAGVSAYFAIDPDYVNKSKEEKTISLVLGAPGVYNWKGSFVLLTERPLPNIVMKRDLFGDQDNYDPAIIPVMNERWAKTGDYIGYSATSGLFFDKNRTVHVGGIPRGATYKGKVMLFDFPTLTRMGVTHFQTLDGDELGSYFGAALAAGDTSGDGLDDLLVGAPYAKQPRVHVFLGSDKGYLIEPAYGPKTLFVKQWGSKSRFGICITTADLNQDSYHDVIVGAPEAEDNGAIAIFLGGPDGPTMEPYQIITAEEVASGLGIRGFGISFAPPIDIDDNLYPDVAVGAYLSGHAVLLRTRPSGYLTASLLPLQRLLTDSNSLQVRFCLRYSWDLLASDSINVTVKVSVDSTFKRAVLRSGKDKIPLTLNKDVEVCQTLDLVFNKKIQNLEDPFEVSINTIVEEPDSKQSLILVAEKEVKGDNKFDKLRPRIPAEGGAATLSLPFAVDCGDDNICQSDLRVKAFFPKYRKKSFVLGSSDSVMLQVEVENLEEPAYLTKALVLVDGHASLARLPANCHDQPQLICNIGNPLRINKPKTLQLEIEMRHVTAKLRNGEVLQVKVQIITSSNDSQPETKFAMAVLNLALDVQTLIAGKTLQVTYPGDYSNISFIYFKHLYEVQNNGSSPVEEIILTVNVPYKYVFKKKEITFLQIYQPEGYQSKQPFMCLDTGFNYSIASSESDIAYSDEDPTDKSAELRNETSTKRRKRSIYYKGIEYFKPLLVPRDVVKSLSLKKKGKSRVRREEENVVVTLPVNRTVRLTCKEPNVLCHEIRCVVGPFRKSQNVAKLMISVALNVSLLKETVMGVKDILVLDTVGEARVVTLHGEQATTSVRSVFVTSPTKSEVALWVIVLSIILGMLLLLMLAMGLVKAGFFERKKKEELEALKQTLDAEQHPEAQAECEEQSLQEVDIDLTLDN